MPEYPKDKVNAVIDEFLRNASSREKRRTSREAAAEKLVAAIEILMREGVDSGDIIAFDDARAAVEKYRKND